MASQKTSAPSHTELADRLKPFGQEHLLAFWHELDDAGRGRLARQIAAIDLELLTDLFWNTAVAEDWALLARLAEPPPAVRLADRPRGGVNAKQARECGECALVAGEIGVLLTAGGQGSRLGFEHPKGMFPIGPVSNASLLQIHLGKAIAVGRHYRYQSAVRST